jgi:hypothetical protein
MFMIFDSRHKRVNFSKQYYSLSDTLRKRNHYADFLAKIRASSNTNLLIHVQQPKSIFNLFKRTCLIWNLLPKRIVFFSYCYCFSLFFICFFINLKKNYENQTYYNLFKMSVYLDTDSNLLIKTHVIY